METVKEHVGIFDLLWQGFLEILSGSTGHIYFAEQLAEASIC